MSGITTYRWADELGEYLLGFTADPGVQYTIPTVVGNKDYDRFVSTGSTALPYVAPLVIHTPDYISFWVGLISSPYYVKVKAGASVDLAVNVAATEFIALLGDAKSGLRMEAAIQLSFDELLSLVPADAADQLLLDSLLIQTHLDQSYTLNY